MFEKITKLLICKTLVFEQGEDPMSNGAEVIPDVCITVESDSGYIGDTSKEEEADIVVVNKGGRVYNY